MVNRNLKVRVVSATNKKDFEDACDAVLKSCLGKIAYQSNSAINTANGVLYVCFFQIEA